jgi:hypothetical protein
MNKKLFNKLYHVQRKMSLLLKIANIDTKINDYKCKNLRIYKKIKYYINQMKK